MKDFAYSRPLRNERVRMIPRSWLRVRIFSIAFILAFFFSFPLSPAHSETAAKAKKAATDSLDLDQLKAKRASVEAMEGLEDSVKKTSLGFLDRAIQSRTAADALDQETQNFLDKVKSAPDRIKKIQEGLKRPMASPDPSQLLAGADLAWAEQKTHQEEINLTLATTALGKWEAEMEEEKTAPQQIRQETARTQQQLLEIGEELKKAPPQGEHPLVTDARRTFQLAEKRRIEALLKLQQDRLGHHEGMLALLSAEREAASREVAQREALVKAWQAQVMKLRQDQAAQARAEAEAAKKKAPPALEPIQKELDINIKLSQDLEKLTREQGALAVRLESQKKRLQELEEEFALNRKRVETSVLTQTLSLFEPVSPRFHEAPPTARRGGRSRDGGGKTVEGTHPP